MTRRPTALLLLFLSVSCGHRRPETQARKGNENAVTIPAGCRIYVYCPGPGVGPDPFAGMVREAVDGGTDR